MARVLVVDDNEQVAASFCEILRDGGYEVGVAHSAEEALLQESVLDPDLILLDLLLGEGNLTGSVVALALRGGGFGGKILIVTGGMDTTNSALRDKAKAAVDGYLLKPVTSAELLAEVKRQLGDKS